jgi:signal transduction histidine kinase
MLTEPQKNLIVFIVIVIILLALFGVFIVTIIYRYQGKQIAYFKQIEELKVSHLNTLLESQLEVQEQTFQHIAREIHDNIGQKLTLAKLYLNTLTYSDMDTTKVSVKDSLELITEAIRGLSDVSRSMSTEMVLNNGLIKGIEMEVENIKKVKGYNVLFVTSGKEVFLSGNAELVIFRIIQESINNFLKHANGYKIVITLEYTNENLLLEIQDDGKGFDVSKAATGSGLGNIRKRAAMLHSDCLIKSDMNGTLIKIKIPINENTEQEKPDIGR